jgi:stress-induced morphogen
MLKFFSCFSPDAGGCGTMYEIVIEAEAFQGKNTLKQHRLVNDALAGEVEKWHGFTLRTMVPLS